MNWRPHTSVVHFLAKLMKCTTLAASMDLNSNGNSGAALSCFTKLMTRFHLSVTMILRFHAAKLKFYPHRIQYKTIDIVGDTLSSLRYRLYLLALLTGIKVRPTTFRFASNSLYGPSRWQTSAFLHK